jgi:predicted nucleotidyltransferase component of viral defense system
VSLFDQLVNRALENKPELSPLRVVVEKELLHHDILRVLATSGLLSGLTFMGGTCLRACYGSSRLSEDLDFTGGADFTRNVLSSMADNLVKSLNAKYGLEVVVAEPIRETGNVDTWKLKVQTRSGRKDMPAQRINIDVCAVPSYQPRPMMLLNPYGVEMGTSGLVIQAQSREEIFTDKLVAFGLRPNRIKNRDLWDVAWLHQQQVSPALELLASKLSDHRAKVDDYLKAITERTKALQSQPAAVQDFRFEMSRFLPNQIVKETVNSDAFWTYMCGLMNDYTGQVTQTLREQT